LNSKPQFQWADAYVDAPDIGSHWIIEPILPPGGLMNFYGKAKSGKSMAAIGAAVAISSGRPSWLGFPVLTHGPVAYLQIDTPRRTWKERFRIVRAAGHDISRIAIADLDVVPYPFNILQLQHQTWLRHFIEAVQPVLTVVDVLREAHEGNENDSTDMKKVVNALINVCKPGAVLFISHSRKDSAQNAAGAESDLMDEGRGSGYVSGRMDTIVKFTGGKAGVTGMTFKGRQVGQTRKDLESDPETYLPMEKGDLVARQTAVMKMVREHPEKSQTQMAKELADLLNISPSTATRDLKKFTA